MCGFFGDHNYSFKWNTYLVVISGLYTFAHWFLATPLTYSHIYECCNEKWPKNWVIWYLVASFATWFVLATFILLLWFWARNRCGSRIDTSNFKNTIEKQNKNKSCDSDSEFTLTKIEKENLKTEMLVLPETEDFNDKLTVVNVNENQKFEEANSPKANIPIPIDETRSFIQTGVPLQKPIEKSFSKNKALKTPREIFFQDLIAAAASSSNSATTKETNIDQHLAKENKTLEVKISNDFENKNKDEKEENKNNDEIVESSLSQSKNTYFLGSCDLATNLTSEVFIELGEKKS